MGQWNKSLREILVFIDALRDFTQNGGKLRIVTTSYMGATDLKVTARDLPETIQKITATFKNYWNSQDFEGYGIRQKFG